MAKSLPPVSAKVVADVEQFIADFRRAENQSRRSAAAIDKEVDTLFKKTSKKFGLSGIGRDVLQGLGIGSGFALATQAADLIAGHWRRAAEEAQAVEKSTAEQLRLVQGIISARMNDEQRRDAAWKAERAAMREFFDAQAKNAAEAVKWQTRLAGLTGGAQVGSLLDALFGPDGKEMAEKQVEWQRAFAAWDELQRKVEEARRKSAGADVARLEAESAKLRAEEAKAREQMAAAMEKEREQMDGLVEKYRDLLDPTRSIRREIDALRDAFAAGMIPSVAEAETIVGSLEVKLVEASGALERFFGALDAQSASMNKGGPGKVVEAVERISGAAVEMGWAFEEAFEDAIFSGKRFSDVLEQLGRDILRLVLRNAIIGPASGALGGLLGGVFKSMRIPGFAQGGEPPVGKVSMVGESGPELFVPKTAGRIIPNHELRGTGSLVFAPVFNVAAGVTRQELVPMLRQWSRGMLGQIGELQRRGRPISAGAF